MEGTEYHNLGNATARDWCHRLETTADLSLITQTLDRVLSAGPGDKLDADAAREAIAAAEVVARLRGNPDIRDSFTERVDQWVSAHPLQPSRELVRKALAVLTRITKEPSDLLAFWNENDDYWGWPYEVEGLRKRISAAPDPARRARRD